MNILRIAVLSPRLPLGDSRWGHVETAIEPLKIGRLLLLTLIPTKAFRREPPQIVRDPTLNEMRQRLFKISVKKDAKQVKG